MKSNQKNSVAFLCFFLLLFFLPEAERGFQNENGESQRCLLVQFWKKKADTFFDHFEQPTVAPKKKQSRAKKSSVFVQEYSFILWVVRIVDFVGLFVRIVGFVGLIDCIVGLGGLFVRIVGFVELFVCIVGFVGLSLCIVDFVGLFVCIVDSVGCFVCIVVFLWDYSFVLWFSAFCFFGGAPCFFWGGRRLLSRPAPSPPCRLPHPPPSLSPPPFARAPSPAVSPKYEPFPTRAPWCNFR